MKPTEAGLLYWYTSSAILGLLTILNTASRVYSRFRQSSDQRGEDAAVYDTEKVSSALEVKRSARGIRRYMNTLQTAWTRYIILSDFPFPTLPWIRHARRIAGTDLGWSVGYAAGVIVLSFYGTAWDTKAWANQSGWMAIAQIPLIIALAGKNNLISLLTGISYERLNFLHRAAGRVCLLGAWIHTIGYIYLLGGISLIQFQTTLTTWGMTSILGLSLMYVSSIRAVRHRIYEFFVIAHICLAALFLAGVIMHWQAVDVWIYPGIGLWASDRLLRLSRLFLPSFCSFTSIAPPPSTKGTISLLTPSTLKLTLPTNTSWSAGQHFYANLPGQSRFPWETHPFTAATIPTATAGSEGEVSFIIRVREGMTGRMKAQIERTGGEEVQVTGRVEGPYGVKKDLRGKDAVIIFAGGSGISFAVAHLQQIIADAKAGKTACRRVQIVWMVKSRLHLNWIEPLLSPALNSLPPTLQITLHIHITKRSLPNPQSALPQDPAEHGEDWQTYLEERAARPRRTSRLLSSMSWATFGGRDATGDLTALGTRRGSEAVQSWRSREGSAKSETPETPVKQTVLEKGEGESGVTLPTLLWTDGYGGTDIPSEFGFLPYTEPSQGPISPLYRARLQSYDSARSDAYLDPANITPPPRSRQASIDPSYVCPHRDDIPHARTRNVSFVDTLPSPKRTQFSFDSSVGGPGRRSSDPSLSTDLRKPSFGYSVGRKSSLAIITTSYDDPLTPSSPVELEVTLRTPSTSHINFSRPFPVGPISTLQIPPTSAQMSRSSTGDSMASFSSGRHLVPAGSSLEQGSSGNHTPISPFPFSAHAQSTTRHDTQFSPSALDRLVKWHEGRADPAEIIRQNKRDLQYGNLEVMVCGPASLLVAVKKASKGEMGVKEVWKGGVRIGFHAESFGW